MALLVSSEDTEPGAASPATSPSRPRRSRLRFAGAVAVALVFVGLLGLLAEVVTSSPSVCMACHEMKVRAESWKASAHAAVACVDCHEPARKYYAWPLTLTDRAGLIARDVVAHFATPQDSPIDTRSPDVAPMPDAVCLQCHDPNRRATSGFRIKIDHPEHAKRNGSCVSCHVRTAHPVYERGRPLTLMTQCFTCHGNPRMPEAGDECDLCHPSGFDLRPASHVPRAWQRNHGTVSMSDPDQCRLCHEPAYCSDCHGLPMPHPSHWAKPGQSSHSAVARRERAACARCHEDKPDLCSMCHHKAWDPGKGTWAQQHFIEVHTKGAGYCVDCHAPVFCVRCHVSFAIQQD